MDPQEQQLRRGRRVFFSWFLALFGLGCALLVLLLLGTGGVAITSPIILGLMVLAIAGIVALVIVVVALFRARARPGAPVSKG